MAWFYFWKKVQGRITSEDYFELDEDLDESDLQAESEDWAYRVDRSGSSRGYSYGWEQVARPAQDWIDRRIKNVEQNIQNQQAFLEKLKKL